MSPYKIKKNRLIVQRDPEQQHLILDKNYIIFATSIIFFSIIIQWVNQQFYHFTGNNYVNLHGFFSAIVYCLINITGCRVLPEFSRFTSRFVDLLLLLLTYLMIGFATNSIQLTPYLPIDNYLSQYEFLKLEASVIFLNQHPAMHDLLFMIYNSLNHLMILIPLVICILNYRQEIHNFCRFMLLSVGIGFIFYYFFPSCGPASVFDPSIFLDVQHANHIKFWEIHHGTQPTTLDGGLIAFPSFHVIWAWACCRILKTINSYLYYACLLWFIIIAASCFVLGWHYSIDIIFSLCIIAALEKMWATER